MHAELKELLNMNFLMRDSDVTMQYPKREKTVMTLKDQIETLGVEYNCLEIAKNNRFRIVFEPALKFMPFEPFYIDFVKTCDGKMVHRYVDIGFKQGDRQISSGGIVSKPFHKDNPNYVVKGVLDS